MSNPSEDTPAPPSRRDASQPAQPEKGAEAEPQPTQVDLAQAKLPRKTKAKEIPPPGLMGPGTGPSS